MKKGREVIGLPILSYETGKKLGTVKELILDPKQRRVLGFLIHRAVPIGQAKVLPFQAAVNIGPDAIIVRNEPAIVEASSIHEIDTALKAKTTITGLRLYTDQGRDLGTIDDIFFDEKTGELQGFEISKGLVDRLRRRKSFVPFTITSIGPQVVFITTETAQVEQPIAPQQVSEELAESIEALQERALAQLGELQEAVVKATVDQQKSFVIGKAVDRSVVARDGTEILRAGEVVTRETAERAQQEGLLGELVLAVAIRAVKEAAESIRVRLLRAIEGKASEAAAELVDESRTRAALGRPVQRAVLDHEERVILNAGEMVTHEALRRAREAGVLEELLGAVVMEEPGTVEGKAHYKPGEPRASRRL